MMDGTSQPPPDGTTTTLPSPRGPSAAADGRAAPPPTAASGSETASRAQRATTPPTAVVPPTQQRAPITTEIANGGRPLDERPADGGAAGRRKTVKIVAAPPMVQARPSSFAHAVGPRWYAPPTLLADCLHNSTRSTLITMVTYAFVVTCAATIIIFSLQSTEPQHATVVSWNVPPPTRAMFGRPMPPFAVRVSSVVVGSSGATTATTAAVPSDNPVVGVAVRLVAYPFVPVHIGLSAPAFEQPPYYALSPPEGVKGPSFADSTSSSTVMEVSCVESLLGLRPLTANTIDSSFCSADAFVRASGEQPFYDGHASSLDDSSEMRSSLEDARCPPRSSPAARCDDVLVASITVITDAKGIARFDNVTLAHGFPTTYVVSVVVFAAISRVDAGALTPSVGTSQQQSSLPELAAVAAGLATGTSVLGSRRALVEFLAPTTAIAATSAAVVSRTVVSGEEDRGAAGAAETALMAVQVKATLLVNALDVIDIVAQLQQDAGGAASSSSASRSRSGESSTSDSIAAPDSSASNDSQMGSTSNRHGNSSSSSSHHATWHATLTSLVLAARVLPVDLANDFLCASPSEGRTSSVLGQATASTPLLAQLDPRSSMAVVFGAEWAPLSPQLALSNGLDGFMSVNISMTVLVTASNDPRVYLAVYFLGAMTPVSVLPSATDSIPTLILAPFVISADGGRADDDASPPPSPSWVPTGVSAMGPADLSRMGQGGYSVVSNQKLNISVEAYYRSYRAAANSSSGILDNNGSRRVGLGMVRAAARPCVVGGLQYLYAPEFQPFDLLSPMLSLAITSTSTNSSSPNDNFNVYTGNMATELTATGMSGAYNLILAVDGVATVASLHVRSAINASQCTVSYGLSWTALAEDEKYKASGPVAAAVGRPVPTVVVGRPAMFLPDVEVRDGGGRPLWGLYATVAPRRLSVCVSQTAADNSTACLVVWDAAAALSTAMLGGANGSFANTSFSMAQPVGVRFTANASDPSGTIAFRELIVTFVASDAVLEAATAAFVWSTPIVRAVALVTLDVSVDGVNISSLDYGLVLSKAANITTSPPSTQHPQPSCSIVAGSSIANAMNATTWSSAPGSIVAGDPITVGRGNGGPDGDDAALLANLVEPTVLSSMWALDESGAPRPWQPVMLQVPPPYLLLDGSVPTNAPMSTILVASDRRGWIDLANVTVQRAPPVLSWTNVSRHSRANATLRVSVPLLVRCVPQVVSGIANTASTYVTSPPCTLNHSDSSRCSLPIEQTAANGFLSPWLSKNLWTVMLDSDVATTSMPRELTILGSIGAYADHYDAYADVAPSVAAMLAPVTPWLLPVAPRVASVRIIMPSGNAPPSSSAPATPPAITVPCSYSSAYSLRHNSSSPLALYGTLCTFWAVVDLTMPFETAFAVSPLQVILSVGRLPSLVAPIVDAEAYFVDWMLYCPTSPTSTGLVATNITSGSSAASRYADAFAGLPLETQRQLLLQLQAPYACALAVNVSLRSDLFGSRLTFVLTVDGLVFPNTLVVASTGALGANPTDGATANSTTAAPAPSTHAAEPPAPVCELRVVRPLLVNATTGIILQYPAVSIATRNATSGACDVPLAGARAIAIAYRDAVVVDGSSNASVAAQKGGEDATGAAFSEVVFPPADLFSFLQLSLEGTVSTPSAGAAGLASFDGLTVTSAMPNSTFRLQYRCAGRYVWDPLVVAISAAYVPGRFAILGVEPTASSDGPVFISAVPGVAISNRQVTTAALASGFGRANQIPWAALLLDDNGRRPHSLVNRFFVAQVGFTVVVNGKNLAYVNTLPAPTLSTTVSAGSYTVYYVTPGLDLVTVLSSASSSEATCPSYGIRVSTVPDAIVVLVEAVAYSDIVTARYVDDRAVRTRITNGEPALTGGDPGVRLVLVGGGLFPVVQAVVDGVPVPGVLVTVSMEPVHSRTCTLEAALNGGKSTLLHVAGACGVLAGGTLLTTDALGRAAYQLSPTAAASGWYRLRFSTNVATSTSFEAIQNFFIQKAAAAFGIDALQLRGVISPATDLLQSLLIRAALPASVVHNLLSAVGLPSAITADVFDASNGGIVAVGHSEPFFVSNPVSYINTTSPTTISLGEVSVAELPASVSIPPAAASGNASIALLLNPDGRPVPFGALLFVALVASSVGGGGAMSSSSSVGGPSAGSSFVFSVYSSVGDVTSASSVAVDNHLVLAAGDGVVYVRQLEIQSAVPGHYELWAASAGTVSKGPLLSITIMPAQAPAIDLQLRIVSFLVILLLLPLLVLNIPYTSWRWVPLGVVSMLVIAVLAVAKFSDYLQGAGAIVLGGAWKWFEGGKDVTRVATNGLASGYTLLLLSLYALMIVSLVVLVVMLVGNYFRRRKHARDVAENHVDKSSYDAPPPEAIMDSNNEHRMWHAFHYTRWLITARRSEPPFTVAEYRHQLNDKIRQSILFKFQERVLRRFSISFVNIAPFVTTRQNMTLPPLQCPSFIRPAFVPLKYYIVLSISAVVVCVMVILSIFAMQMVTDAILRIREYIPSSDDVKSSEQLSMGITMMQVLLEEAVRALPSLRFVQRAIEPFLSTDAIAKLCQVGVFFDQLLDALTYAVPIAHALAIMSCVSVASYMYRVILRSVMRVRRGDYERLSDEATLPAGDEYIGTHCLLFVVQHQLVFWANLFVLALLLCPIVRSVVWAFVSLSVVTTFAIDIGAKLLRYTLVSVFIVNDRTVHRPRLYSVYSVVMAVLGVFSGAVGSVKRLIVSLAALGFLFPLVHVGLFPREYETFDDGFVKFYSMVFSDVEYNSPIKLTFIAILLVDSKLRRRAMAATKEGCWTLLDTAAAAGGTGGAAPRTSVGGDEDEEEQSADSGGASLDARLIEMSDLADNYALSEISTMDPSLFVNKTDEEVAELSETTLFGLSSFGTMAVPNVTNIVRQRMRHLLLSSHRKAWVRQEYREKGLKMARLSVYLQSQLAPRKAGHLISVRYFRGARRWWLLYLLHRNPSLRAWRKHALRSAVATDVPRVSEGTSGSAVVRVASERIDGSRSS